MSNSNREQSRLTLLRLRELRGEATESELAEIAAILAKIAADEAITLAPTIARLKQEGDALDAETAILQTQNTALSVVLRQHEQLVSDVRVFLAELDSRHQQIHADYAAITGTPLTAT